jgi:hypothetical protein
MRLTYDSAMEKLLPAEYASRPAVNRFGAECVSSSSGPGKT